jgi:hypothetical protein
VGVDRVAAAQRRVQAVRAELYSPAAAKPCIQCRYFEIVCTHPAAIGLKVSPVSGKAKADYPAAEKVRAEDGACGPEGALFDSRSPGGLAAVYVLTSKLGPWLIFLGLMILLDGLLR